LVIGGNMEPRTGREHVNLTVRTVANSLISQFRLCSESTPQTRERGRRGRAGVVLSPDFLTGGGSGLREAWAWAKKRQMACKPGSVPDCSGDGHSSGTCLAACLARPTRTAARKQAFAVPIWSCSRWGLPCHLRYRRRGALLPHLFTLTRALLPVGGVLSVALSLGSPPPDVIRHRVSMEPGLSSSRFRGQRPSGHLTPPL
jgi:hypothetical protein